MKKMKHTELRRKFLEFFKSKGHTVVPSDSLVPAGDPTLLFTSAGMNQFKEQFMGNIKGFRRAASCQKCLRTGDLENVGKTLYHHTFFEMLGNFSFGGYFKEEAIAWAWEFMKDILKIPEEKLWASVYIEDEEAYNIWKDKVGLPREKIVRLGAKENFWPSEAKEKGPNGPCGPCSEIFYDQGSGIGCGKEDCTPACDCGRFVEAWNLVFTQFERKEGGALSTLPSKNIDTGMGLERLCAVMQGKVSNFETDLFAPIIKSIKDEIGSQRITNYELRITEIYAIADHIRASVFAIADGVGPSNEERGYVIRNLIRKAALCGRNLGAEKPFLYKLAYSVGKAMEEPYPEIIKRHEDIAGVIKFEEERFASTLKDGGRLLEETIEDLAKSDKNVIPGEAAFRLFDTHGLPLSVIKELAALHGTGVDEEKFNGLMEAQREQSRKTSKMHEAVFVDSGISERTEFIGYDRSKAKAKVLRILTVDGKDIDRADKDTPKVEIILDKSVFYGESGGQAGDTGRISAAGLEARIDGARRLQDAIILETSIEKGELKKGDIVDTSVDEQRRLDIARNHTATHLLQSALRKVLGEHVQQQGSFVGDKYLRLDFSHYKALTRDELDRAEELIDQYIKAGHAIEVKEMSLEEARKSGALAFFGDKYEQKVRVVSCADYSKELCGGTHLKNTAEIGLFKITGESSIASGIRRIEARTSQAAEEWIEENSNAREKKEEALRKKEEAKVLAKEKLNKVAEYVDDILAKAREISGVSLIVTPLEDANMDILKKAADIIKTRLKSFMLFLATASEGKVSFLVSISDDLLKKGLDAGKIIGEVAKAVGGSGGGRPNMALGGARDTGKLGDILKEARDILTKEITGQATS